MIGYICERGHFTGDQGATAAIKGFVTGYGGLDSELAFRIAVHAGVQLIGWYIRRAPDAPLQFPLKKVTDAIGIKRDWIVKGELKDSNYYNNTPLAPLFKFSEEFNRFRGLRG